MMLPAKINDLVSFAAGSSTYYGYLKKVEMDEKGTYYSVQTHPDDPFKKVGYVTAAKVMAKEDTASRAFDHDENVKSDYVTTDMTRRPRIP